MSTPIWPLFQTVLGSIIQVILVCISGYILARRGILDKPTQKQLNVINVNFFTPCLLFSKVAFFLSPAKLRELWIIPIFFLFVSGVSLAVAWLLGNLFRLKPSQRNFAMAAATFMNSNSLPVALLQSLAATVPGLKWGQDDTKDAIIGRALTYLLLCSTIGQFLRWSYGVHLLSKSDPLEETENTPEHDEGGSTSTGERVETSEHPEHPFGLFTDGRDRDPWCKSPVSCSCFYSFPSTPYSSGVSLPTDQTTTSIFDSDGESDDELRVPAWSRPPPTYLQRVGRSARSIWKKVTDFLTPPLWASIISLAVALNQPLQHMLEVHMQPLQGALPKQAIAQSLSLSSTRSWRRASFASSLREIFRLKGREEDGQSRTPQRVSKGEGKTVFVSILARMVVVPALFLPFMAIGALWDHPPVFQDPVFILSNVLLLASPPALTLAQITQAVSSDAFEKLLSRTIFWSYCFVTPPAMVGYALIAMLITKL
ncbi:membrane transport protein-domain-containing protein [Multifurca ochricompacta]|uniref:Membrane transport protein-domain-containing protein n=1 Tax=Multifurca ochricompacta TaxID=376703 RepID=A0AAD4M4I6_9AGAM|nr:membrane transport protein-domain-containing protein [Multifurca ochricompacta]